MIETPRFEVFKNKWKKRIKTVILEIVTSKKLSVLRYICYMFQRCSRSMLDGRDNTVGIECLPGLMVWKDPQT